MGKTKNRKLAVVVPNMIGRGRGASSNDTPASASTIIKIRDGFIRYYPHVFRVCWVIKWLHEHLNLFDI
jgi:hypothetical protein